MLSGSRSSATCRQAVDQLYNDRHIRLWVVYVDSFSGQDAVSWADEPRCSSATSATRMRILAVATTDRAYAFLVPTDSARSASTSASLRTQRNRTGTAPERLGRRRDRRGRRAQPDDVVDGHGDLVVRARRGVRGARPRGAAAVAVAPAPSPQAARGRVRRGAPGRSRRPERVGRGADRRPRRPVQVDRRRRRQRRAHQRQRIGFGGRGIRRTTRPHRSARRSATRRPRWRRRSTCARSSTTPCPRPRSSGATC